MSLLEAKVLFDSIAVIFLMSGHGFEGMQKRHFFVSCAVFVSHVLLDLLHRAKT